MDAVNGSGSQTIALAVSAPGSTITPSVVTDGSGMATAVLHTGTAAGFNNITATYRGIVYHIPVTVTGPPAILNLIVAPSFRLANGVSTATASASVYDQWHNPIGGAVVNFTVDGAPFAVVTDAAGTASRGIGPYGSTHTANVTANAGGMNQQASVRFLDKNNLILSRYPAASLPIESYAEVKAVFYENLGSQTPAVGVPLTFTAYGPDFAVLDTYSGVTDANGSVEFYFTMSNKVGNNTVVASNSDMGGILKSTIIYGEGGDVSDILLTSSPGSPVYADGSTRYTLNIWAVDAGGNPVKNKQLSVIKNSDTNYTYYPEPTNVNGYTSITTPASRFVCDDNYTVTAARYDLANNTTEYISRSITLSYQPGPAAAICVIADPNAVANANVSTPDGSPDVHTTDITAMVTDQWGHPIKGETVTITSLNNTLGSITGAASGPTAASGEFTTQFTLNSSNYGNDTVEGAPVEARSGSLYALTHVLYTEDSFLSIKSSISPKDNVSVNDTIDVNITVRGIGWKIRGQSYDVALIFDSSGSMDWLSTMSYPTGSPLTGTMSADGSRHTIMTFHNDKVQNIEIMVSSSYRNYDNGSYYTSLMITGPPFGYYGSPTTYYGTRSSNENYEIITNAPVGDYTVSAQFVHTFAGGTPPYNAMVLVNPKRLGKSSDLDSAAKVAATQFVNNMTDNQVSVVWFNDSYYHNTSCYWGVVGWHYEGSGWNKHKVDDYGWIPSDYVTEDSNVSIGLKTIDSVNKTGILDAVNSLNANGGTHIGAGIETAINELTGPHANKSNQKVAILLSDGYSQSPTDDIDQATAAAAAGIRIFTIGMGMPDADTLNRIANITGTKNMSLALSSGDLEHVYGSIAGELKKVVASQTDMHVITRTAVINGTLYPDAVYVPGSAYVTYPNGTVVAQEPTIKTDGTYDLSWSPGVIKLNDTWTLNYKLKVLKNGTIEPITDESYINYIREDNSSGTSSFSVETLYVGGNSSNDVDTNSSKLKLTITYPLNASHGLTPYNVTSKGQLVRWTVNYTGNYTYRQTILLDGVVVKTDYPGNEYTVDLTAGDHLMEAKAIEDINGVSGDEASDTILLRVIYNNGQITLV